MFVHPAGRCDGRYLSSHFGLWGKGCVLRMPEQAHRRKLVLTNSRSYPALCCQSSYLFHGWEKFNSYLSVSLDTCCCCCYYVTSLVSDSVCNPIDSSLPGSPVPGILKARTLEWVAISFSNAWKWRVKVKPFSHVWLLGTPWTAAHQAPVSMGFS